MLEQQESQFIDDQHFEREVRRIARILWPSAALDRSPIVDGLERDAIVQTPDITIVIEATTSRRKDKAEHDGKKTNELVKKVRGQGFACKGIFVTLHEPTADQGEAIKKYRTSVEMQSFDQFLSRVFDGPAYLQMRLQRPFGSIQNPKDLRSELQRDFYIPIPIRNDSDNSIHSAADLAGSLQRDSSRIAIVADFGSGKSMSLREVFYQLRDAFITKKHMRFPLYINLRDHTGAKYPDEILERHARELGLTDYGQLVRAWRSGFVDLLLDGFDEFAATGWSSTAFKLRQIRRTMLQAVRTLIAESPPQVGVIVAGRQHYFDSEREMSEALGLSADFRLMRIDLLTEADAAKIVRKYGGKKVPDWLPSRALLLSYLAARNFLGDIEGLALENSSRGLSWDALLKMICDRESKQHTALDGGSILSFIERLATLARQTNDGLGSFSEEDLSSAFQITCGFPADDAARVLISRLPALGPVAQETGRRRFIDPDIADAARAGDTLRYIQSPFDNSISGNFREAQVALGSNGLERLSFLAEQRRIHTSLIEVAAEHASRTSLFILALDTLQLLMYWTADFTKSHVDVRDIQFESMTFEEAVPDFSRVTFWDCVFEHLSLSQDVDIKRLPRFRRCLIGSLDGIATLGDLPTEVFLDCDVIELASSTARNATILGTDLPIATKVLLTVLNKLFMQAGRGRKENAFVRGLDTRAKLLVPQILGVVQSYNFASPTKIRGQTIWFPNRDKTRRVGDILERPSTSADPLLDRIRNL